MSTPTLALPPGAVPADGHRSSSTPPVRPKFNSHITSDRLREGTGLYMTLFKTTSNIQKGRRSVFKEMGLDDEHDDNSDSHDQDHCVARAGSNSNSNSSNSIYTLGSQSPLASPPSNGGRGRDLHQSCIPSPSIPQITIDGRTQSQHEGSLQSPTEFAQHHRQNSVSPRPWYIKLAYPKPRSFVPRVVSGSSTR